MKAPKGYWVGKKHEFTEHDYEWLHSEYVVKGKSSYEIAAEVGAYASTICNWLNDAGLTRSVAERGRRHSKVMSDEGNPAWTGGAVPYYRRKLAKTREPRCKWCGSIEKIVMHHVDHDRTNHADDNLIWLCGPCHWVETAIYPTIKDGRATLEFDETKHELTIKFRR